MTRRIVALALALMMALTLCACGSSNTAAETPADTAEGTTVLRVAMECAYAPYNWTQPDDSNGAVPIAGSSDYANGYDVMIAKAICEANGWELEIVKSD